MQQKSKKQLEAEAIKNQVRFPDAEYDEETGAFKGYKPKVVGRAEEPTAPQPVTKPPQAKGIGAQLWQDLTETVDDIKDEPSEVPYRVGERIRSYFRPKRKVKYAVPK